MNLYLKTIITIVVCLGSFGYAIPTMVSQPDSVFLAGGIMILAITPYSLYLLWREEIERLQSRLEDSETTKESPNEEV